jgi:hypothetical protein
MLGKCFSDLETGDVFQPVEYVMTPFIIREYAHGVAEDWPGFHGPAPDTGGVQLMTPCLSHIEKQRLLKVNCPGGPGPTARIHFEYHAKHFTAIPAGTSLVTSGSVTDRYTKNGRDYVCLTIEVHDKETGQLYTLYRDRSVLNYKPQEEA